MPDPELKQIDVTGFWSNRDIIREKTESAPFDSWWISFVDRVRHQDDLPLENMAFVCALLEDEELAERSRTRLMDSLPGYVKAAIPAAKEMYPELNADLTTGASTKYLAYVYSFLYPTLSQEDHEAVQSELRRGGEMLDREARAGAWWGNGPNTNWTSHMMSGLTLAALALRPSGSDESDRWLETALGPLRAMLHMASPEGAGIEGPGYWTGCYRSVQEVVEALRNTGGEDWYDHPFWARCVDFPLYMMRPDRSGLINFSDTGDGLHCSQFHFAVASALDNGLSQWFGDTVMGRGEPSIWDLLTRNPEVVATPPDTVPTDRLFESAHVANFRTGWDEDAVSVIFKGGSNAWSHCHLDLNSFFIDAFGDRLVADPGPGPYSHDYFTSVTPEVSTAWHNTLVVDGADQRQPPRYRMSFDLEEAGDAYCPLSDFRSADGIAMVTGDATTAYGDFLDRFVRTFVFLKPDCFVIFDDILAKDVRTQRHYQWLLHSGFPIEPKDGSFEIFGEAARLTVRPLLPEPCHHKFLEPRAPERADTVFNCLSLRPIWHHLWNVSPSQSPYPQWDECSPEQLYGRELQFLVVLTLARNGQDDSKTVERIDADGVHTVSIQDGESRSIVRFNPSGSPFEIGDIKSDADQLVLHLESDEPKSWSAVRASHLSYDGKDLAL